jgi:rhodanese-related sulfurtransferase
MKSYADLVNDCLSDIDELFPWDLAEELEQGKQVLLVDVSEPYEYDKVHIPKSINVPRGILESACEYDYEETVPVLAANRDQDIVLICRSGNRSALAAYTMKNMGFSKVRSLKTGLRGWNDYEQPLVNGNEDAVDIDDADEYFTTKLRPEQESPK